MNILISKILSHPQLESCGCVVELFPDELPYEITTELIMVLLRHGIPLCIRCIERTPVAGKWLGRKFDCQGLIDLSKTIK